MRTELLHPFLGYFDREEQEQILRAKPDYKLGPNTVIFDEGDPYDGIYLVISGKVNFHKTLPNRKLHYVSSTGEGSHFGELGIFNDQPRSLRAVTVSTAHLIHLEEDTIIKLIEANKFPLVNCIQGLVRHLHETTEQYVESVVHQQQLAIIGQMVSSLIHDFRSPLGTISLGAQFLQTRHSDDSKTLKTCQTIESQVNRINRMTIDILDYVRGEQHLELRSICFPEFFEEFRELFPNFFQSFDTRIEIECRESVSIVGDFDRIVRIFQNLVSNALDVLANHPESAIHITCKKVDSQICFTIADNGPGIPEEIRETLFEPFVTHGKRHGTGLGMAIVKRYVDAHKGKISFTTDDTGTAFEMLFPLAREETN